MRDSSQPPPALRSVIVVGLITSALYGVVCAAQHLIAFGPLSLWPVALYVAATLATFALYARIIGAAARGALAEPRARAAALVFPVLINVALISVPPSLSIDVFSYVGHGYQGMVGENPYAQPLRELQATRFGAELEDRGWLAVHGVSPYGPIWTWFEIAVGRAFGDVTVRVRVIKATITGFSLLCAFLVWRILGRISPGDQLKGTLLYLWNPVVMMELAGEGHNEAVVIAAVLLSLGLCLSQRVGASVVAMGLGVLVKIPAAITAAPQLAFWLRNVGNRRLLRGLALGGSAVAALAVLSYAPLWIGAATLDGVRAHGRPSVLASTPGVLYWHLTRSHSEAASAWVVALLTTGVLVSYVVFTSVKAIDARSTLRACGRIAVVYLMLAPGYWPWYATLPVALMALSPDRTFTYAIIVVSVASRLAAPLERLRINGLMDWNASVITTTVIGLWAPAILLAAGAAWIAWRAGHPRLKATWAPTLARF
jgi:alpha-1,6-mannosyltransferase